MPKAYSLDLREKVLGSYKRSIKKNKYEIAKRYNVSYDFVNNLIKLYEETNDIKPRPRLGKKPQRLTGEDLKYLDLTVKANNDLTLRELCELLEKDSGVKVGTTVMFRALKKLNLTLKKSHLNQMQEIQKK